MPYKLDKLDVLILNSLLDDGRKSFRQVAKEIASTTPTVQARYQRLVNLGFIKSISPIIDKTKLDKETQKQITKSPPSHKSKKIPENSTLSVNCDYCGGPTTKDLKTLRFGSYERFFCCTSCRKLYREKYGGRIKSLSSVIEEN